ncbi:MAG: peptidoglycan-associated lipoprotein Pal [Woeseia sp.]|jgi:peptidoglycan-associated lipoprotein
MTHFKLLVTVLLVLSLAACAKKDTLPDPEPDPDYVAGQGNNDASSRGFGNDGLGAGEEFGDESMNGELGIVVYFGFDQSELRPEYADLLAQHANRLANNSRMSVRLEGHADERGSREYNIGLGERRAQTVRRMLLIQGAAASQIATVSFGEERPAAFGSDEESYELNRRVEIKYLN